ncbi:FimV/HubP family polar landmark protein [Massilia sp. H6]|uniref:FimV/HubP family polar landmark protein n=1 Tax=Massilia sp. H6 TaxID=2970464 RepID=UPI0021685748|nr:FimV/HubP family polar landmark protein [Massilia sp. H6]UVW27744.1 LysM peptidoglycan-binding domain-containing protein [Massilia sp. H6]
MAFALKTATAAVASAVLLSAAASAAGLGKLTVLSALGQPLRAEIELTTTAGEDASSLAVKLASPEAFRAANIEFNPALLSLRFNVEARGGRQFIRLSSTQPLNEPFVDMLLELSWNNGRLVREYTFLLDPAELRTTQPAMAAADTQRPAAAVAAAQARPATPPPAAPPAQPEARRDTAPLAPRAAAPVAAPAADAPGSAAPARYRVRPGDTLSKIATRLKPADISLDMMLVSLYRANPDAFIGNNMNRLKSGQILSVPDAGALRGAGQGEATAVVVAHAADFNAYRNKLAGQVASAAPQRTPQAGQSAAGKITAKVEERPTAANESQDQLRLSRATQTAAGAAGVAGDTAATEDRIARERELAQAQARVKELERNVSELESLMTVKSRTGSDTQNAAAAGAIGAAATGAADQAAAAAPAPVAKPADRIKPKKQPKPEEKSFADTLMDNINLVGAAAAVLLLAAFGLSRRKKKKEDDRILDAEPSVLGVPNQAAHSLYAQTGGQSVDTSNSVFNSSFAPSASQLDTNEVDPVAEADVYIAYGRDAQAEEILKEALRNQPERHAVRLKLLEIYAARKDLRAFESQASELHGISRGQGDEWAQAAALGLSIDPANPLYASAAGAAPVAPTPSPQERDQQSLLSQQLEDAFRSSAPGAALGAGAVAATTAYGTMDHDDGTALPMAGAAARADDNALDFDLGGLSFEPVANGEPTAMPGAGAPDAPDYSQDDTAVPDLEFALDPLGDSITGSTTESVAESPAELAAAPAPASDDPFDLAFDMSFGEPDAAPQPHAGSAALNASGADVDMAGLAAEFDLPPLPAVSEDEVPMFAAASSAAPEATPAAGSLENDPLFDLDTMDFGLPAVPAMPAAVVEATPFHEDLPAMKAAPAPVGSADDPLFDLDTMDFGSPGESAAPASVPAPASVEPFEFDAPPATRDEAPALESGYRSAADFQFNADADADPFALPQEQAAAPAPVVPAAPSFDLGDIDLDLPAQPGVAGADLPQAGESFEPAAMSPEHMEMETKLDLAIAYQEIGDKEGARELLDEVIKGGNSQQVSKASAMRSLLA